MSKAGIAAVVFGIALAGCGGGSSDETGTQSSGGQQTLERSAALSWNAPDQRQNGEGLKMGELAGYVINYGQDPENLDKSVVIDNASTMEYTVKNLGVGTWHFSVQVEDTSGLMSPPSDLVSKTIKG
ncbi:fibronectin type III domain-containing protein [Marinobacter halotolerans]|uniref:fibronectin type III domain-containing protein n=1 Tax=Marinobacter halotolerans TaxID=1569211 RepID=UPI001CD91BB6|nr:fibronectin type III domain-containing protein [Marinobacter halotolerans]